MSGTVEKKASLFERFTPILLVVTIVLAFLVGVLWQKVSNLEGKDSKTTTETQQQTPEPIKVSNDQIKGLFDKDVVRFGNKDSKVIFVEVSDPSCPYCHIAGGLNPELNSQVGDQFKLVKNGGKYVAPVVEMKKLVDSGKASFVWLYFNGHGNGELATKALYCAHEKGKFWEAHDLLMTNKAYTFINDTVKNDMTKTGDMANFLKSAVDTVEMKNCLDSDKYKDRLSSDMNLGRELGVTGTPSFFVNETNFAGAYSFTNIEPVVNSALE